MSTTLLRQGSKSAEVGLAQQALIEAGFFIAAAELSAKSFGPSTHDAVVAYQRASGLVADGVIGPKTGASLFGGADSRFIASGWRSDAKYAATKEVVERAINFIGLVEKPPGSNRGADIDKWNAAASIPEGSPWCASFATSMFDFAHSGNPFGKPLGSAYKVGKWATSKKRTVDRSAPAIAGDVGVIMRDATHGHVVIIVADLGDGRIATVEGNAGNAVRGMVRQRASLDMLVRPVQLIV